MYADVYLVQLVCDEYESGAMLNNTMHNISEPLMLSSFFRMCLVIKTFVKSFGSAEHACMCN